MLTLRILLFLLAMVSTAAIVNPPAKTQPVAPALGFHIAQGDDAHMAAARSAGADFVVIVFKWADIEPTPGYFYWEKTDAAVRAARYRGLDLIARLDHPPAWALDSATPTPWDLDAYAEFVRQATARYGDDLTAVVIGNEPNLTLEWHDKQPDGAAYAQLLHTLYPAIKAINPELPVVMAGLAFTEGDARNVNDLDFLQAVYDAGGGDSFDILAAHPYGFGRPPADKPDRDRLNFRRLELHREIMLAQGDSAKPIWITEMGWRTRAPDPADAWQVVTPEQQTRYLRDALAYAAQNQVWIQRTAVWQLNRDGDEYGYDLWAGPEAVSPAYAALVAAHAPRVIAADREDRGQITPDAGIIEALAPDTIIRLGDIGTLHPHWVHLYNSGVNFSPRWQGEFFVAANATDSEYDLYLETMQVDQAANRISVNGQEIATLQPRTRPDPTSTWVTQRFSVPPKMLRAGVNTVEISVGLRTPAWQYATWRWENLQVRNIRLMPRKDVGAPSMDWRQLATPGSWDDPIRLRAGRAGDYWLTTNRRGGLWHGDVAGGELLAATDSRTDLLYTDLLPTAQGELAATDRGLRWRQAGQTIWQEVEGAPEAYAFVVLSAGGSYWAGFEVGGVWRAERPTGPWEQHGLPARTVLDLAYDEVGRLIYAATDVGVFMHESAGEWRDLPPLRGAQSNFVNRLFLSADGELVARVDDQLWRLTDDGTVWSPFGPVDVDKAYMVANCCGAETIVATDMGLWQLHAVDGWRLIDRDDTLKTIDGRLIDLIQMDNLLIAAGDTGLMQSNDRGATWRRVGGLASIVSDIVMDDDRAGAWLAGGPSGLYRSNDGGRTWRSASPPWVIQQMAKGGDDRVYLATSHGVWFWDEAQAPPEWRQAQGFARVHVFTVAPDPADDAVAWAGTWGNDIGVSVDGGRTLSRLGNGLETLSVLSILHHAQRPRISIATIEGIYQSRDGGQSWAKLAGPLSDQTVYDLYEDRFGALWAAAADGLWQSDDMGATWTRQPHLGVTTVIHLGARLQDGGSMLLWAGTESDGIWYSEDNGERWHYGGLSGLSVYRLLADPDEPGRLIAATNSGLFETYAPTQ